MITLHHCLSARSFRPLWMLEELGVGYTLQVLPFPPRVRARAFLETNPLGTVPALFDGHLRMTESAAICQYLAARFFPGHLDVGLDEPDFGSYLNLLHFGEATLTFPQTLVLRYRHFESPERRQPHVADDYARWFRHGCGPWTRSSRSTSSYVPTDSRQPTCRWVMRCCWRST